MPIEVSSRGVAVAPPAPGTTWYAATGGASGNAGTIGSPWDLKSALLGGTGGTAIQPGDTLLVRSGTYTGLFNCTLAGTALKPINVKNYPGERATIDAYVHTTLTGVMTNVQTTVPMAQIQVPDNQVINIGTESIRIHTSYSAGAYQGVDRGWDGTTAASHSTSDAVDTDNGHALTITGTYTYVTGLEVTVSVSRYANRTNPQAGSNPFGRPPSGIELNGTGNKVINCVVHDTTDGYSTSAGAADNYEFHGCLGYYVGWDASDRGHGHAYYLHNDNPSTSVGLLTNCIALSSFDLNAQIYTGGATLGNVRADGNFSSQAGVLSSFGPVIEFLFGLDPGPLTNSVLTNSGFYANGANGFGLSWGYAGGTTDGCTLTNNYVAAQNTACAFKTSTNFTTSGNTWIGPSSAPNPASGTFLSWKPGSGKTILISKNLYEVGRANIAVFNWDNSASVNLDFSSFLSNGDTYVVRNAWNYYGTALATGTWNGTPVAVNTSGLTIAAPVGKSAPTETGAEFNIFIVSKT